MYPRVAVSEPQARSQERKTGARGITMRFEDDVIASYLDDQWRTPGEVHRLMKNHGSGHDIAYALERLARAGQIENKHEAAVGGRSGMRVLCVNYYRKLQKYKL
jgi:hypothetical protein